MAAAAQGAKSKLAIGGYQMCFVRLQDLSNYGLVDAGDDSMCGVLDHYAAEVTVGAQWFRMHVLMQPSPEEMDILLPLMGLAESPTDTFTISDTLTSFSVIVDRVTKVHTYATCYVDKWIWRGQKGRKPVSLELQIVGTSMTEANSGTFSASTLTNTAPWSFVQGTLTLYDAAENFDRFALACDHKIEVSHNNSATATSITPTDRSIHLVTNTPYSTDESSVLTTLIGSSRADGDNATIAFARTGQTSSLALANIKAEANPPSILGKTEIRHAQTWKVYRTAATASMIWTHDSTV